MKKKPVPHPEPAFGEMRVAGNVPRPFNTPARIGHKELKMRALRRKSKK